MADDSRPLLLTCRLCGTGVDVPLEQDDPPVVVTEQEQPLPAQPTVVAEATAPAAPAPMTAKTSAAELAAGRQPVAQALAGLLAQRTAATAPL